MKLMWLLHLSESAQYGRPRCVVAGFLARGSAARSIRCEEYSARSLSSFRNTQHVYEGMRWMVVDGDLVDGKGQNWMRNAFLRALSRVRMKCAQRFQSAPTQRILRNVSDAWSDDHVRQEFEVEPPANVSCVSVQRCILCLIRFLFLSVERVETGLVRLALWTVRPIIPLVIKKKSLRQTIGPFDLLHSSHKWIPTVVMWEIQHNSAGLDYFNSLILQETSKTENQHPEEFCAYSGATRLSQKVGWARNKLQFHTFLQKLKSFLSWCRFTHGRYSRSHSLGFGDWSISLRTEQDWTTQERAPVQTRCRQPSQTCTTCIQFKHSNDIPTGIHHIPSNTMQSSASAMLHVFEDNAAVIRMLSKEEDPQWDMFHGPTELLGQPLSGQKSFTVISLHINNNYAKNRQEVAVNDTCSVSWREGWPGRWWFLDEKVDLVAGDFRTTCASALSILEKAFVDFDLPMPPNPTPSWGPGAVPGTWSDVCGFIKPPDSNERWSVRQHGAFPIRHEALSTRQTDQSCHPRGMPPPWMAQQSITSRKTRSTNSLERTFSAVPLQQTKRSHERGCKRPFAFFVLGQPIAANSVYRFLQRERWDLCTNPRKVREVPQTLQNRKNAHGMINDLDNVDFISSNVHSSRKEALLCVFEDNEAVIKMIIKGRSPTMRHVSRTHRVALDWLFDRITFGPQTSKSSTSTTKTNSLTS